MKSSLTTTRINMCIRQTYRNTFLQIPSPIKTQHVFFVKLFTYTVSLGKNTHKHTHTYIYIYTEWFLPKGTISRIANTRRVIDNVCFANSRLAKAPDQILRTVTQPSVVSTAWHDVHIYICYASTPIVDSRDRGKGRPDSRSRFE